MTRLIGADALKELMIEVLEHIKENPKMDGQERHIIAGIHMLGEMIDDAPTVDAIPVEWIKKYMSRCLAIEQDAIGEMVKEWAERREE